MNSVIIFWIECQLLMLKSLTEFVYCSSSSFRLSSLNKALNENLEVFGITGLMGIDIAQVHTLFAQTFVY